MKQIKKIAITNEKGGVGKTMTAVNLSACLAQRGYRVLLIDADPQGYATLNYDVDVSPSLLEVLRGQVACTKAVQTTRFGVDVLPSDRTLSVIEEDLIRQKMNGAPYLNTLEKALEDLPDYDFVIIDCPPQGGRLMDIVHYYADAIIMPMFAEDYGIHALTLKAEAIADIRRTINPNLKILGGLITMDERRGLRSVFREVLLGQDLLPMFSTTIRRNVALIRAVNTYLKIADITQFTESEKDGGRTDSHIEVLYAIDKVKGADMLAAIGLADGKNSYENANALDANNWYYQSDVLSAALKAALEANSTTVKNSLEAYVKNNGGTAMTETNEDGYSNVTGLPVGLYLLVETRTPEMVTGTTNPCFVSLPMTTVDGGMADGSGNQITTGGHDWNYNVVLYPKNETGIVTLEKTVREAVKDTGKNNATDVITDGFTHNATASAGDTIEYQIISTLPTITSAATNISAYTFQDVLARGLSYVGGTNSVTLEFFTDANCTNKVTTWKQSDGKFKVTREENNDGTHTMTISMTDDGLAEINTANTAYDNDNGKLYAGYSNYTLRIRYDAKLNSDESLVYGDNGNKNEVVLTWKRTNGTYYDTLIDDAHIYTYATNITKTFSDGKEEQTMFDNVLFKAQNASDGYYVIAQLNEDEGIWYVTGHTDKEASATAMHPVEWNGKKGQIILKGVEDDQYIWTELETANGYTLLKNNIDVTIKSVDDANRPCDIYGKDTLGVIQNDPRYNFPNNEDYKLANIPQKQLAHNYQTASATVDGNDVTMLDDEMDTDSTNAIAPLTVVNTRVFITPMTGDRGTQALAIGGVLVFCLGTSAFIFFLVFKRRKEQEDK